MSETTPGPWAWANPEEAPTHRELIQEGYGIGDADSILYHGADWPIQEANARLIAAAPDLLTALEEAAELLRQTARHDAEGSFYVAWQRAAHAIDKATGVGVEA